MPLPIAHAAIAVCLTRIIPMGSQMGSPSRRRLSVLALGFIAAVSPDFDFIPGLLSGETNRFHQGPTHSLFGAALCGLLVYLFFLPFLKGLPKIALIIYAMLAALFHPVLDLFSRDTRPPIGVPLFWPFAEGHVISPFPLFRSVHRSSEAGEFFASLFSLHNFMAAGQELIFGLILITATWAFTKKRKSS